MVPLGVNAYMKGAGFALVLILAACGVSSAPQARSSVPPSATPTPIEATATPSPTAGPKLTWAAPVRVDHQPTFAGGSFSGVSCPTSTFCAVDGVGKVLVSSDPTGGAAAWTANNVGPAGAGGGMACPTIRLCVSIGGGYVIASSTPNGGAAAWKVTHVEATKDVTSVSCPSSSLCVGVDTRGKVVTSTNPTGGAAAWTTAHVDGSNYLTGVSCPNISFCVAVDTRGNVISSTNPTGGVGAWKVTISGAPGLSPPYGNGLSSVSCLSSTLCVAGDYLGNMMTSTNPAGGAAAWKVTHVDGSQCTTSETGAPCAVTGVSCITGLCVGADYLGNLVTSTNPTGGVKAWKVTHVGSSVTGVSCPSTRLCVVVDVFGDVITSTNPTGGLAAWRLANVAGCAALQNDEGSCSLSGVSCPSAALCVAVDAMGNVVTSSNPTGGAAAWKSTRVDGVNSLSGVSCPSSSLCVAVDYYGNVVTSSNPTGGAAAWKVTHVDGPSWCPPPSQSDASPCSLTGVSCPNDGLCVAVDYSGNVVTSINPTGGTAAWKLTHVDSYEFQDFPLNGLASVSCPSSSLCVAVDDGGNTVTSRNPTGGAAAWTVTNVEEGAFLLGVSCPSSDLCVVIDNNGNVVTSDTPTGGGEAWKVTPLAGPSSCAPSCSLTGLSCPSTTFCVAVDSIGDVLTSSDPTGEAVAWQETKKDGSNFSGVSCPSISLCVAVDGIGNVIVGTGRP